MHYLITPSSKGWPRLAGSFWQEADDWTDLQQKLPDPLIVEPSCHPPTWVDFKRQVSGSEHDYLAFEPTPRMYAIHQTRLCCPKAVVLPCMCTTAYACPDHSPYQQRCVGSHD